jgi:hypothetical protein
MDVVLVSLYLDTFDFYFYITDVDFFVWSFLIDSGKQTSEILVNGVCSTLHRLWCDFPVLRHMLGYTNDQQRHH